MTTVLHAEWTKLRTTSGPAWLLAAVVALTTGVGIAAAAATRCPAGPRCPVDPARLALTGVQAGQAIVAVLGVLVMCGEYSTGMIRTTFAAVPRREMVLGAKAVSATGLVLVTALAAVGACLLAGALMLPGHGFTTGRGYPALSLTDGPVARAAAGSVLYLALIALVAISVGAIVRDSAMAIGVTLGLLYLFPITGALIGNAR